jgi:hypothetical protein
VPLTRLSALTLLALAGCSSASTVAELAPEVFGLTAHGNTPAAAAQLGVARAQRHCGEMGRGFEVTRSEIGARDYTIAFRCPRPEATATAGGGMPYLAPLPEPGAGQRAQAGRGRGTAPAPGGVSGTDETF